MKDRTYKLITDRVHKARTTFPDFPENLADKKSVMDEEDGEVAKVINERNLHYLSKTQARLKFTDELLDVIATAIRCIEE